MKHENTDEKCLLVSSKCCTTATRGAGGVESSVEGCVINVEFLRSPTVDAAGFDSLNGLVHLCLANISWLCGFGSHAGLAVPD